MPFPQDEGVTREEMRSMLALTMVPNLGPALFHHLLRAFGSAEAVFRARPAELAEEAPRLQPAQSAALLSGPDLPAVEAQARACRDRGVRLVSFRSAEYPAPLLDLANPPPFLYVRGTWLREDAKSVSVVGTRRPSEYGAKVGREISLGLAESGWTLVSGLARGIDTLAHAAALAAGARTAAVMGTGFDQVYPPENAGLAGRIEAGGCLLSEFPMGWPSVAANFPRRNRLISALSLGTLVVEAGSGSGALITARHALDQGKEIFAVPGSIYNPAARGTHQLIQEGAHLVASAGDVLDILRGLSQAVPARRFGVDTPAPSEPESAPPAPPDGLLDLLARRPASLEEISTKARAARREVPPRELLAGLLRLEIQGKARRLPGSLFQLA